MSFLDCNPLFVDEEKTIYKKMAIAMKDGPILTKSA